MILYPFNIEQKTLKIQKHKNIIIRKISIDFMHCFHQYIHKYNY